MRGSDGDFRAGINLFTNGRLRQKDLIEDITTKGLAEEYLYGEIHVDGFEDKKIDRFTSSREGIIKDDPLYQEFIKKLKNIIAIIIKDWTPWRREIKSEDWDVSQGNIPRYVARLEQSKNAREKDFEGKIDENIGDENVKKTLKEKLQKLSSKNTLIYQDLFILENIFREYIKIKNIKESDLNITKNEEKVIIDEIKSVRTLRQRGEERHVLKGKIVKEEHYLNYLDLFYLGEIIDILIQKIFKEPKRKYRKGLELDTKEIEPVRNPVMHTNEITDDVLKWNKIKNVIDYIERLKDN
ncbi:MAG: hypothetical protein Q8L01_00150 [Candidatus Woesebacteria bacterium]|nr:hypothetical protein [Candidatus Woesebacteria bacterium]